MAKQSQGEIDQMIQRSRCKNGDLVRRDIIQVIQSSQCSFVLQLAGYYLNDGSYREYLCLNGTVVCQYKGSRYNIPVEINLNENHPFIPPSSFVKPTANMFISPNNQDVQLDGTITLNYLRTWRHPQSDLSNLINAMSQSFSQSPPVYSSSSPAPTQSTPYPTNISSMPMPMPMPMGINSSPVHSYGYPPAAAAAQIPRDVYRESLQSAVLDKVRNNLNEKMEMIKSEIDSLKKNEEDLNNGEKTIELLINNAQQQQQQAQSYINNLKIKQSSSTSSSPKKENSIKDEVIIIRAPIYKQLFESYAEEHAIQDLLYYLADGLRRQSIPLNTYLKHVRELSRRQFILRATMNQCRQIAGLPIK